jgi:hypothetical protein
MQWDMDVCHACYTVPFGRGNVPFKFIDGTL